MDREACRLVQAAARVEPRDRRHQLVAPSTHTHTHTHRIQRARWSSPPLTPSFATAGTSRYAPTHTTHARTHATTGTSRRVPTNTFSLFPPSWRPPPPSPTYPYARTHARTPARTLGFAGCKDAQRARAQPNHRHSLSESQEQRGGGGWRVLSERGVGRCQFNK